MVNPHELMDCGSPLPFFVPRGGASKDSTPPSADNASFQSARGRAHSKPWRTCFAREVAERRGAVVPYRFRSRRDAPRNVPHLNRHRHVVPKRQRAGALQALADLLRPGGREASWTAVVPYRFRSRRDAHRKVPHLDCPRRVVPKRQRAGALQALADLLRPGGREASWTAVAPYRFRSRRDAPRNVPYLNRPRRVVPKRQGAGALGRLALG